MNSNDVMFRMNFLFSPRRYNILPAFPKWDGHAVSRMGGAGRGTLNAKEALHAKLAASSSVKPLSFTFIKTEYFHSS